MMQLVLVPDKCYMEELMEGRKAGRENLCASYHIASQLQIHPSPCEKPDNISTSLPTSMMFSFVRR